VLVLTIPIMLLSEMVQHWLNIHFSFAGSPYILLLLSSIVFFMVVGLFLMVWSMRLKAKNPGMMFLMGLLLQ
jgi:Cu2+-exporting ATPase